MSWSLKVKAEKRLEEEIGVYYKQQADLSVALVFPNTYFIGMSNLGFQTIYRLLNERSDTLCERAFLPDKGEIEEFKRTRTQLFTMEHQRPLLGFDLVAFSISFEMDYFHLITILNLSNIPLFRQHRDEGYPLIIAGGIAITSNYEPLVEFIDAFVIGEGEVVVNKLVETYLKDKACPRQELLLALSQLPGVYVPGYSKSPAEQQRLPNLNSYPTYSCIVTPKTEFSQMFLIEVGRGCPRGCRFCLASYLYRPYRYRGIDCLISQVKEGLKMTSRIGLICSALADYPYLIELCQGIKAFGATVFLSSLGIDALTGDLLLLIDQQTITLAIEAGSYRLRKIIRKGLTDEKILNRIEMVNNFHHRLKLYFMIGLPTEEQADLEALAKLVKRIRMVFKGRLSLSISPFVPKPHTPFQDAIMDKESILKKKLSYLKQELKGIEISGESIKSSLLQWRLSIGDSKVGQELLLKQWGRL